MHCRNIEGQFVSFFQVRSVCMYVLTDQVPRGLVFSLPPSLSIWTLYGCLLATVLIPVSGGRLPPSALWVEGGLVAAVLPAFRVRVAWWCRAGFLLRLGGLPFLQQQKREKGALGKWWVAKCSPVVALDKEHSQRCSPFGEVFVPVSGVFLRQVCRLSMWVVFWWCWGVFC
jgi:hypothetical protein